MCQAIYRDYVVLFLGDYISSWVGTIWKQNLNLQIALDLIFKKKPS
jgi:hypothetical protein